MKQVILAMGLLLILGCGLEPGQRPDEVHPPIDPIKPEEGIEVVLVVYGANWCSICKSELPEIQRELDKLPESVREKIAFKLYVPTGNTSATLPTQESADRYRDFLHLDAEAVIDPRWQHFKNMIGGSLALPAGAILDSEGKVKKAFKPGMAFIPSEIVQFAVALLSVR